MGDPVLTQRQTDLLAFDPVASIGAALDASPDQEEAAAAARTAMVLSELSGLSIDEAVANLPELTSIYLGPHPADYKTAGRSVMDEFVRGLGDMAVGLLSFKRILDGDTDESLAARVDSIRKIQPATDALSRPWYVQGLKLAAQNVPQIALTVAASQATLGLAGLGIAGVEGIASAAVKGTALASRALKVSEFATKYLPLAMRGAEVATNGAMISGLAYDTLRRGGATHEVAAPLAVFNGYIQAAIENNLKFVGGLLPGGKAASRLAGRASGLLFSTGILEHGLPNLLGKMLFMAGEEGAEEALQAIPDMIATNLAAAQTEGGTLQEIPLFSMDALKNIGQQAYGGFLAALFLGGPSTFATSHQDVRFLRQTREMAKVAPDAKTFAENALAQPQAEDMDPKVWTPILEKLWATQHAAAAEQKATATGSPAAAPAPLPPQAAANVQRAEGGRLFIAESVLNPGAEGPQEIRLDAGDPASKLRYGHATITLDEAAGTVTVEELAAKRDYPIQAELIQEIARRYPEYEVAWNPTDSRSLAVKDNLVATNPRGSQYGLNWFGPDDEVKNPEVQAFAARRSKFKSDLLAAQPAISSEQADTALALVDRRARRLMEEGKIASTEDYYGRFFHELAFTSDQGALQSFDQELAAQVASQGDMVNGATLLKDAKSLVYLAKTSDYRTLMHELMHAFVNESRATGVDLRTMEEAFGVEGGVWTTPNTEAAATAFEIFAENGKVKDEALRPLFERIYEFMHELYGVLKDIIGVQLKPEINDAFEQFFRNSAVEVPGADTVEKAVAATPELAGAQVEKKISPRKKARAKVDLKGKKVTAEGSTERAAAAAVRREAKSALNSVNIAQGEAQGGKGKAEVAYQRSDALWDVGSLTQEFPSAATSINAGKLPATFARLQAGPGDVIADIGGGRFDNAVAWAAERGAQLHVVDPFNRTVAQNKAAIAAVANGKSSIATANNVLNVIKEPANRERVILQAYDALRPGGKAHFLIYEGNGSGKGSATQGGKSWQNNRRAAAYLPEVEAVFGQATRSGNLITATKQAIAARPAVNPDSLPAVAAAEIQALAADVPGIQDPWALAPEETNNAETLQERSDAAHEVYFMLSRADMRLGAKIAANPTEYLRRWDVISRAAELSKTILNTIKGDYDIMMKPVFAWGQANRPDLVTTIASLREQIAATKNADKKAILRMKAGGLERDLLDAYRASGGETPFIVGSKTTASQEVNSVLARHPEKLAEVRALQAELGTTIFNEDGSLIDHPIEHRQDERGRQFFFNMQRLVPQMLLDNMGDAQFEEMRAPIVRAVEQAYEAWRASPDNGKKPYASSDPGKISAMATKSFAVSSALKAAEKTLAAFNFNTMCPMFIIGAHGCYLDGCYVTGMARSSSGVKMYNSAMYAGEILQLSNEWIEKLNAVGGLRFNGMGDVVYGNRIKAQMTDVMRHAMMRGLKLKIITKQENTLKLIQEIIDGPDPKASYTARNTIVQTSNDPYWLPCDMDNRPGSAMSQYVSTYNAKYNAVKKAEAEGSADLNGLRSELNSAEEILREEYKRNNLDFRVMANGKAYRKYGFSFSRIEEIAKKYPDVHVQVRAVVGCPEEIVWYALNAPKVLQTWMHAKIPKGMYSEVLGRDLLDGEIGNYTKRTKIMKDANGEWRILRQNPKMKEGGKAERMRFAEESTANFNDPKSADSPYRILESYIKSALSREDANRVFEVLSGQNGDPSALCCTAGASADACNDCASLCQSRSYLSGQSLADEARAINQDLTNYEPLPSIAVSKAGKEVSFQGMNPLTIADKMRGESDPRVRQVWLRALLETYAPAALVEVAQVETRVAPIAQSTDDLARLYEDASNAQPQLKDMLNRYAARYGARVLMRPALKSMERVRTKLAFDDAPASTLGDINAGTLVFDDFQALAAAAKELDGTVAVRVKNRMVKGVTGYRDILTNVTTPNGHISEVLMGTPAMMVAKFGPGHTLYEVFRDVEAAEKAGAIDPLVAADFLSGIAGVQHELYDQAFAYDLAGFTIDSASDLVMTDAASRISAWLTSSLDSVLADSTRQHLEEWRVKATNTSPSTFMNIASGQSRASGMGGTNIVMGASTSSIYTAKDRVKEEVVAQFTPKELAFAPNMAKVLEDARGFASWEDFKAAQEKLAAEGVVGPAETMDAKDADEWYRNVYNLAQAQERQARSPVETGEFIPPEDADRLFMADLVREDYAGMRALLTDWATKKVKMFTRPGRGEATSYNYFDALAVRSAMGREISPRALRWATSYVKNRARTFRHLAAGWWQDEAMIQQVEREQGQTLEAIPAPSALEPTWAAAPDTTRIAQARLDTEAARLREGELRDALVAGSRTIGQAEQDIEAKAAEVKVAQAQANALKGKLGEFEAAFTEKEKAVAAKIREAVDMRKAVAAEASAKTRAAKQKRPYSGDLDAMRARYEGLKKEIAVLRSSLPKDSALRRFEAADKERGYLAAYKKEREARAAVRERAKERKALRAERDLMRAVAKKMKRKLSINVEVGYREMIRGIQNTVDDAFHGKKYLGRTAQMREVLAANPDLAEVMGRETLARILERPLNEWTLPQLVELSDRVEMLKKLGRLKRRLRLANERTSRKSDQRLVKLATAGTEALVRTVGKAKESNPAQKLAFQTWKPDRIALWMDGGKPGIFTKLLVTDVNDSWNAMTGHVHARHNKIADLMKKLQITGSPISLPGWIRALDTVDIGGFKGEGGWQPTWNDVMYWYIASGNERAMRALTQGNGIPEAVIRSGIAMLDPRLKTLAEAVRDDFESRWEALRTAYREMYNIDLPKEASYLPMQRLGSSYTQRGEDIAADMAARAGWTKAAIPKGMLQARINIQEAYQAPIRTDLIGVWSSGVQREEAFINQEKMVRHMNAVVEDLPTRRAIESKFGSASTQWLRNYANDVARPDLHRQAVGVSKFVKGTMGRIAKSALSFNTMSYLKQAATSWIPFVVDAGPIHVAAAAAEFAADAKGFIKEVYDKSPLVANRANDTMWRSMVVGDSTNFERSLSQISDWGMKPLEWIDTTEVAIGWKAVYEAKKKQGADETEARRAADSAVVRTQPSGRIQDMAQIYRTQSDLSRLMLMFTSSLNSFWNMITYDIPAEVKSGQVHKAIGDATAIALTGVAMALCMGVGGGKEPEDKWKEYLKAAGQQFTDSIPLFGAFTTNVLMGGYYRGGVNPFPVFDDIYKIKKQLTEGDIDDAVWLSFIGAARASGLPAVEMNRIYKAASTGNWSLALGRKE
jgi:hypothetical protein